ncbi:MAG: beta-lactamase family protein [Clostridiales bacterium]|nr:beta-lactamase family protein [Clostridiales bacterium]
MKRIVVLLLAVMLCLTVASAEEQTLEDRLARTFKNLKTTGAVLCVAKDGEIVYEYYYGYADKRTKEKANEESYFRTASVTKLVTGIHVMQLVEQGALELDTSIGDYLGYEIKNLYHPKIPVTLRHLMSHTSSLNPNGGYSVSSRPLQQILDAKLRRKGNWYDYEPGSKYKYSNFGAGIMGSLVEIATGKNVNDSMTETLFEPLGIDAALHPSLVKEPEKITTQYMADGSVMKARKTAINSKWDAGVNPEMHFRITVGSLWIRGRDLCRLGIMMVQEGALEGKQVLKPETVQLMMDDQNGKGYVTVSSPYGLCVNRVDNLVKGKMFYGHQGLSEGVLCNLYWDPQSQFVFALISNGCNSKMSDHIGVLSRRVFELMWEEFGE